MKHIGLVLSAGGPTGDPWHAGVLAALEERTGWDARSADLIAGTSAGSIVGLMLRAGLSPLDRYADHRGQPVSSAGRAVLDRMVTPWTDEHKPRDWRPQSPRMALRAALPPWSLRPLHLAVGLLPPGTRRSGALASRMSELHPQRWPDEPLWIPAVRLDDGRRVVFGRDDVRGTVAEAVRASCGVPGYYEPTPIGSRRYVDGGVHSSTNADLLAPLAFDVVIVSSAMTAVPDELGLTRGRATRAWMASRLASEVAAIRQHGTAVLVVQPDAEALEVLESEPLSGHRKRVAEAAYRTTMGRLDARDGPGLSEMLVRVGV